MYDEELKGLEDQLSDLLRAVDRLSGEQRLDKYNRAQDVLKRLNKVYHQFKVEIRLLEGNEQSVYEKKSVAHGKVIGELKESVQNKRTEANNAGGDAGGSPSGSPSAGGRRNDGKDEARSKTRNIEKTQKQTIESLTTTEQLINETETVATEAASKLQKQTDDIRKMNENLDQLDSDVNRAKKELNVFIRRMMTDKIILCFAVLVVVGIIVIVVMKVKGSSSSTPPPAGAGVTPSPTPSP
ncbi:transmembrane protein, putative [Bodo saltans]|uniref:Transmembrane protein, putative n=1 Tax=Bodo saltans TaxID=75058 RepID=A0A0S4JPW8_BODSA|nr:transmembrane protein, putative [Bodo saltans]|eukprot:CUG92010.1 transmembrane protein, putative [Bodo saltans]